MNSQGAEQSQRGWVLLNGGKCLEAVASFEQAILADDRLLSAHEGLGLALFRELEARDRAVEARRRPGAFSPEDIQEMGKQAPPGSITIDGVIIEGSKFQEVVQMANRSRKALMRAFELGTERVDVWVALARTPGIPAQVREVCVDRALQKDPKNAWANFLQGMQRVHAKDYERARVHLRRAIDAEPDNARWRCEMGSCCLNLERTEEALVELSTAVRLDPKFASSWYNLGTAFLRIGQREAALHAYKTFLSIEPHSSDARALRGLFPELASS